MNHPIIPEYGDYDLQGRIRMDATIALANSNPVLIARGLIDGASKVSKFGSGEDIGTAFVPVTTSHTYQTPMTPESLEIVSDSIDDNGTTSPLGIGALTVEIFGIKDWDEGEIVEKVTLDGTTPVALINGWLRVYRAKVSSSGTYATPAVVSHNSTITVQGAGGGVIWAQIPSVSSVGLAQSEIAVYSVPAGKLAYMRHAEIWIESTRLVNIIFFVREEADVIVAPYSSRQAKLILRGVIDSIDVDPNTPYGPYVGPCDLGWMAEATQTTASIGIDFELLVYDV